MNKISFTTFQACTLFLLITCGGIATPVESSSARAEVINRTRDEAFTNGTQAAESQPPQPNPQLSPEEVVRIVLQSLQQNDTPQPNNGITTAFRFASPATREATGPLDRFITMVRTPNYSPLLNHRSAERDPAQIRDREARVLVTITDASGERINYLFSLSKQGAAPYRDCWMTDGVSRVRARRPPADTRGVARVESRQSTRRLLPTKDA